MKSLRRFINDQLSVWPEAVERYRALKGVRVREMDLNGLRCRLQHNPARIVSSAAPVDAASVKARPCFLCPAQRPDVQRRLVFEGRKGRKYDVLLNPYPIFPDHLVIAARRHTPQSIAQHYVDMMDFAHHHPDFTVFYNGPRCGASAPDHLHFQACPRNLMPLETEADRLLDLATSGMADGGVPNGDEEPSIPGDLANDLSYVSSVQDAQLFHYRHFSRGVFFLRARTSKSMAKLFYRLLDCAPVPEGESEPMINLLTWYHPLSGIRRPGSRPTGYTHGLADYEYRAAVIFRGAHRSRHWNETGARHLTMSPGCADMAGLFIVPVPEDYEKLDAGMMCELLSDVSVSEETERGILWRLTRSQQMLEVGIMAAEEIVFEMISDGAGPQKVSWCEGKIAYGGVLYDSLYFEAQTPSTLFAGPSFILHDVEIGIQFHWHRRENQLFAGSLKFIVEGRRVRAVNVIGVEDYLSSVISSEMKPTASLEFLKAHAVISRSWVLARLRKDGGRKEIPFLCDNTPALVTWLDTQAARGPVSGASGDMLVRWYDQEDHKGFTVCADDHCQRYQGLTRICDARARKAVDETWGLVLTFGDALCDTRFSKCCGGRMERFSTCWDDRDPSYLQALPDTPGHREDADPFCHTDDPKVLGQVLNDYDLETRDFYEWTVRYTEDELSEIVRERSGIDFGRILSLEPVETGPSGRIRLLRIRGSKAEYKIGKELEIRRILSRTHLKSSAFTVEHRDGMFLLHGRGWGHGVGLCQIGAAVMADRGYDFRQILLHYYPGTELTRL